MDSFNAIYLLNLHGSIIKQEAVPEGKENQNVFDIKVGVVILLCVKKRSTPGPARLHYADLWGNREERYRTLLDIDVQATEWCELQPTAPLYLFVPQSTELRLEYEAGWEISDIFQEYSTGIVTSRDKLTLHHTEQALRNVVTDFTSLTELEAKRKYNLKDSGDWSVASAQADIRSHPDAEQHVSRVRYRPFDARWTYYTRQSSGFHTRPRPQVMHHLQKENLALCVCRIVTGPVWQHALVTDKITEKCYISNSGSESGHVFPLYLYPDSEGLEISTERSLNFKPAFLIALSEALELPQTAPFNLPEGIATGGNSWLYLCDFA